MQAVRLDDGAGTTYLLANTHCTSYPPDERLPDAELLRAAWFASSLARPEDVVILAGDFNVRAERSRTLRDLTGPEWGFSQPGPGIDHVLVRGARRVGGAALARRTARARRPAVVGSCAGGGRHRMSWADERARFPVLEQFAYFNAGTNGPLVAADARRDGRAAQLGGHPRSRREGVLRRHDRAKRARACAARAAARRAGRERRADRVDDAGRARRRHRARARPVRRGRDDRRRAFRALGPAVRVGRVAPHRTRARRAGEGCLRARAPRGDAAHEADRDSRPSRGSTGRCSRGRSCARRPGFRFSSTALSPPVRSTSTQPRRTSTR